jgi:hypothetical protein
MGNSCEIGELRASADPRPPPIGSPTQIAVNLAADGITTKAWTTLEGQTRNGTRI